MVASHGGQERQADEDPHQWLTSRHPSTVVVAAATGALAATNVPIIVVSTMPTPPGAS